MRNVAFHGRGGVQRKTFESKKLKMLRNQGERPRRRGEKKRERARPLLSEWCEKGRNKGRRRGRGRTNYRKVAPATKEDSTEGGSEKRGKKRGPACGEEELYLWLLDVERSVDLGKMAQLKHSMSGDSLR